MGAKEEAAREKIRARDADIKPAPLPKETSYDEMLQRTGDLIRQPAAVKTAAEQREATQEANERAEEDRQRSIGAGEQEPKQEPKQAPKQETSKKAFNNTTLSNRTVNVPRITQLPESPSIQKPGSAHMANRPPGEVKKAG